MSVFIKEFQFWIGTRVVVAAVLTLLLSACGGGGGGGGGGGNSSTSNKLTVNAGADLTVNMLTRVDLDPKVLVANVSSAKLSNQGLELLGSSDNKDSIVALTWSKVEGPDFAISSSGFNDGIIYFIAPSTNGASSIKITFKIKITNAAGVSAEDTITITVNRVNQAPVANAGTDIVVEDNTEVVLNGSLSTDRDGNISKYQWSQVAGSAVTIINPNDKSASFVAPLVNADITLEFELTVTDNEGAISKDKVLVTVNQGGAPRVELYFPTKNAIYLDATLPVFGAVSVRDATIASVTIDVGAGPLPAVVKTDGTWRLDDLAVPAGVAEFTVNVEVLDSLGRKGSTTARLKTSTRNKVGDGQDWDGVIGISVDSEMNRLWVMNSVAGSKSARLFSVDLNNGNRSPTVSDFGNSAQGVSNNALAQMTFDAQTKRVFVTAAPSSESVLDQILQIDTLTGIRSLVSDKTHGTGPELKLPYGISAAKSGELFVVDNQSSTILSVDVDSGDRKVIADANTGPYGVDAPMFIVADSNQSPERLFWMPNSKENYVFALDLTQKPAVSRVVTGGNVGSGSYLFGSMIGVVVDNKANKLFLGTSFGDLYEVDISTGARREIANLSGLVEQIAFDEKRGLVYVIDDLPETLYAVDPVSGRYSIVSKATDF